MKKFMIGLLLSIFTMCVYDANAYWVRFGTAELTPASIYEGTSSLTCSGTYVYCLKHTGNSESPTSGDEVTVRHNGSEFKATLLSGTYNNDGSSDSNGEIYILTDMKKK